MYTKFCLLTPFLYELNTDIGKITYFVPRIYVNDERMVQFFANAPHLFKTVRNEPKRDEVSTVFDEIYHNKSGYRANQWSSVVLLILQYFQSGIS